MARPRSACAAPYEALPSADQGVVGAKVQVDPADGQVLAVHSIVRTVIPSEDVCGATKLSESDHRC
jgi:hypothetical protein